MVTLEGPPAERGRAETGCLGWPRWGLLALSPSGILPEAPELDPRGAGHCQWAADPSFGIAHHTLCSKDTEQWFP